MLQNNTGFNILQNTGDGEMQVGRSSKIRVADFRAKMCNAPRDIYNVPTFMMVTNHMYVQQ